MKKITPERLKNIALFYLERFEASENKLKNVLYRRIQRAERMGLDVPADTPEWIQNVIDEMKRLGYINNQRYAENKIRQMLQSGKSKRYIMGKLAEAGIDSAMILPLLPDTELTQARIFAKKKKLGADETKDLAKLARAGFPYHISVQVLKEIKNDESIGTN